MKYRLMLVCATLMLLSFKEAVFVEPVVVEREVRPMFGTRPPDCKALEGVGRHREWSACMGVGYVDTE